MPTLYKKKDQEYYFKVGNSWVHEALIDFIISYKEERSY